MTSRRSSGLSTAAPVLLALIALLALSVQFVAAGADNVSITKSSSAGADLQAPGDTYTYTLTTTVGAQAVTELRIQDGSIDYPQVSITSATYTINGGAAVDCATNGGNAGPTDVDCRVGSAPAGANVVVTIGVTVASDVNVACDNPDPLIPPGTLDDDVRNRADVDWRDADNPAPAALWTVQSNLVVTDLDCTGFGSGGLPETTITAGPANGSTTTSTSAAFSFSGTNSPTSFECKLDAGAFAACTSPKNYSGLSVGSHTFEVRAINATGTDPTPAARTWTIEADAGHPFTDIDSSPFKEDIIWLYNEGITTGCSPTLFCPLGNVTRAQMASFLVRALDLPPTATDFFSDDNGNFHEDDINALAAAGITTGCGVGKYCPTVNVLRDQMASFLVRAYDLAPSTTNFFTDDNGNFHEANINALAAAGVTNGCGGGKYCPTSPVTREQMAAFIHRAAL